MKKYSYAWFAERRCYKFTTREVKEVNQLVKGGATVSQAVAFMKAKDPKWAQEVNDTKHILTPREMGWEKRPWFFDIPTAEYELKPLLRLAARYRSGQGIVNTNLL